MGLMGKLFSRKEVGRVGSSAILGEHNKLARARYVDAEWDRIDGNGRNAITLSCFMGYGVFLDLVANETITVDELETFAEFNLLTPDWTARVEVLNILLEENVNSTLRDIMNNSAFDYAVVNNHARAIKLLVQAGGLDVNEPHPFTGVHPLQTALVNAGTSGLALTALLDLGATASRATLMGKLPGDLALRSVLDIFLTEKAGRSIVAVRDRLLKLLEPTGELDVGSQGGPSSDAAAIASDAAHALVDGDSVALAAAAERARELIQSSAPAEQEEENTVENGEDAEKGDSSLRKKIELKAQRAAKDAAKKAAKQAQKASKQAEKASARAARTATVTPTPGDEGVEDATPTAPPKKSRRKPNRSVPSKPSQESSDEL